MIDWIGRRNGLRDNWSKLPLAQKFIISGGSFTLAAMLLCGILTTSFLTEIVLQRRAGIVSALAQYILQPMVRDLGDGATLDQSALDELGAMLKDPVFTAEFPHLDLWLPDGRLLYSSTPGLVEQNLPMPPPVSAALEGHVSAQFSDVTSEVHAAHGFKDDFIEVFFPLYRQGTEEVIVVAQFREMTATLERDLWALTLSSWATVAIISSVLMIGMFSIVLEGSRTIERQGRVLSRRLAHSHARAAHHRELKAAAQNASRNVTELTDKYLRTIGTDLHDGPAQSIGFAVLKLDQVRRLAEVSQRNAIVSDVENILGGALGEIRAIATALVLPDIADLDLAQVVDHAVHQHVMRTDLAIAVENRLEAVQVAPEISVCVFRFIQEGLNNAFHHGLPDGQTVTAVTQVGVLKLSITNKYVADQPSRCADHLGIGLYGLRARVQSIGGNFTFVQSNGETRLEMWLHHA